MTEISHSQEKHREGASIHLPAPTVWPIVLAFGCTMAAAGMVTTTGVSILGGVLMLAGCIGWFRQVLPQEQHEEVPVVHRPVEIVSTRPLVERIRLHPEHRAHLPVETYPVVSGIKRRHRRWYRHDLSGADLWPYRAAQHLVSGQSPRRRRRWRAGATPPPLRSPHFTGRHFSSLLPFTSASVCSSDSFTALCCPCSPAIRCSSAAFLRPCSGRDSSTRPWALSTRLSMRASPGDGFSYPKSTFGSTAGLVVSKHSRVPTGQSLPFAARLGIETPGLMVADEDAGPPHSQGQENKPDDEEKG